MRYLSKNTVCGVQEQINIQTRNVDTWEGCTLMSHHVGR